MLQLQQLAANKLLIWYYKEKVTGIPKKKNKKHLLSAAQTVTDTLGLFLEFFEAGSFGKGVLKGAGNKAGGGFNDH